MQKVKTEERKKKLKKEGKAKKFQKLKDKNWKGVNNEELRKVESL